MLGVVVRARCWSTALAPEPSAASRPYGSTSLGRAIDPKAGIMNLDHLIFIGVENRSFDHYFGTFPGADGIPMDANGNPTVCSPDPAQPGTCHAPYHDTNFIDQGGPHGTDGLDHRYQRREDGRVRDRVASIGNGCRINPATRHGCRPGDTTGPHGTADVMGHHTADQIPIYWTYAERFTLQDRMFAPSRLVDAARAPVPGLGVVGDLSQTSTR